MRLVDALAGAAMALALSIQPGCALPREDLSQCQGLGLFSDPIPVECWGDEEQQRLARIDAAHQRAVRSVGIPPPVLIDGQTVTPPTRPAPWLTVAAEGGDWAEVPGAPVCLHPELVQPPEGGVIRWRVGP